MNNTTRRRSRSWWNRPFHRFFQKKKVACGPPGHDRKKDKDNEVPKSSRGGSFEPVTTYSVSFRSNSSHSLNSSSNPASRPKVSFGDEDRRSRNINSKRNSKVKNVVVHVVMPRSDFAAEEKSAYWYTKTEIREFGRCAAQEADQIVEQLIQDNENNKNGNETARKKTTKARLPAVDHSYLALRGFESVTPLLQQKRTANKNRVHRAVFEEQRRQREQGWYNSEVLGAELAEVSAAASKKSKRHARKIARHDTAAAYRRRKRNSSNCQPSKRSRE